MKKLLFLISLVSISFINAQITFKLKPNAEKGKDALYGTTSQHNGINYGNNTIDIIVAWTFNGESGSMYTLFDFDWSVLPQNAMVSNAKVKFFANNGELGNQEFHSTLSGPNDSWLERITSTWDEQTLTNLNAPTTTDINRVSIPASDSINQDFEIDVTQLVNDMIQNPSQGFGFLWKLQNDNYYRRLGFCSSDNSDPSKWPEITITFEAPGVSGKVFNDVNQNCLQDINELDLSNRLIEIQPGNYYAQTNEAGVWHADLPLGTYTATLINNDVTWTSNCSLINNFTVTDLTNSQTIPSFALHTNLACSSPNISIYSNILRRCFSEQEIYVQASNSFQASADLENSYAEINLDPLFTLDSATISFVDLGNNLFRFDLGTLSPNESANFTLYTTLSCDAVLLETLCHEAKLFPVEACVLDSIPAEPTSGVSPCTLPWDRSSLVVDGWCQNDSVYFTITNHGEFGNGDMDCYAPVRIYLDGVLITLDSIKLVGGETFTYSFAGNGQTWILQADQHPLHPGNSHPNAHVEMCGNIANWIPDIINNFPQDDADPIVDIFCTVTNGSYDPNDKRGFPHGITENNYILPNQELEYIVRFQNTGTDTAFTVVIRDTLDSDLDITQIVTSNSSHNYTFKIYGQRILEWTFNDILLVDSNTNEPGSHGFIQFSVKQIPNLPNFTEINNEADIYFDFNVPVITNQTSHVINNGINSIANLTTNKLNLNTFISVYPNPTSNKVNIKSELKLIDAIYQVTDISGKIVLSGKLTNDVSNEIDFNKLTVGLYIVNLKENNISHQFKIIKN